jgi:hypothetical protein
MGFDVFAGGHRHLSISLYPAPGGLDAMARESTRFTGASWRAASPPQDTILPHSRRELHPAEMSVSVIVIPAQSQGNHTWHDSRDSKP